MSIVVRPAVVRNRRSILIRLRRCTTTSKSRVEQIFTKESFRKFGLNTIKFAAQASNLVQIQCKFQIIFVFLPKSSFCIRSPATASTSIAATPSILSGSPRMSRQASPKRVKEWWESSLEDVLDSCWGGNSAFAMQPHIQAKIILYRG